MARTHSLQKEKRMEPWRESGWQRQEAGRMETGWEPKQRRFGAKPVSETKQLRYLCLDSAANTRTWVHFVVSMLFWGLTRIRLGGGEGGGALVHQTQCIFGQSGKVLFLSKTENRAFHFLTERTQLLATFPVGTARLLCPIQVCKTTVISIALWKKNYNSPVSSDRVLENVDNG